MPKQKPKRRFRFIAFTIASIAILPLLVIWQFTSYFNNERIRSMAQDYLQQYSPGQVTVGSAEFSWLDGIVLTDVSIADTADMPIDDGSPASDFAFPTFSCPSVMLTPRWTESLSSGLRIDAITAIEPTCRIVRDADLGRTNIADILHMIESLEGNGKPGLPTIELRNAHVIVIDRTSDSQRTVQDLTLSFRGRTARQDSRFYDVVWQQENPNFAQGHSRIDLETGRVTNIKGGLPWLSIEAVMFAINAKYPEAGTWSDLLGIEGKVRVSDYHLDRDEGDQRGRSVTIELNEAALSIPISEDETALRADERYLRFEQVVGTVQVSAEGVSADFRGLFHGSKCIVSAGLAGSIDGQANLENVDISVNIKAENLSWPQVGANAPADESRFIHHWRAIEKFYVNFQPNGPIDLEIRGSKRAGTDQTWSIEKIALDAKGGGMNFHLFPYAVTGLSGLTEITPDGVFIRNLVARRGDATITVKGTLTGTHAWDAADLSIVGTDVPIDDALIDALSPRYRQIQEQFQPEGTVHAQVTLHRTAAPKGQRGRWNTQTSVTLQGVTASYQKFPYTVTDLAGTFTVDSGGIVIDELRGRAGEGEVVVHGSVSNTDSKSGSMLVAIEVDAKNLTINDRLINALPPRTQHWVRSLHLSGNADVAATIVRGMNQPQTTYDSSITLRRATARPEFFPARLENLHGVFVATPESLTFLDAAAEYRGATVTAWGLIDLQDPITVNSFKVECADLHPDKDLYAALPEAFQQQLGDWKIDGPVDLDAEIASDPLAHDRKLSGSGTIRLKDATIHHPRLPLPLRETKGTISFRGQGLRTSGVSAQYGPATVALDLHSYRANGSTQTSASLVMKGLKLDESIYSMIPEQFIGTWRSMAPSGLIDLNIDRLEFRASEPDRPAGLFVDGSIDLHGVSLRRLGNLRGLQGRVTMQGWLVDQRQGINLSGTCRLTEGYLFDHRLSNIETPWTLARAASGRGRIAFDAIRADLYGGTLAAATEVTFDSSETRVSAEATIRQMNIDEFLSATSRVSPSDGSTPSIRGKANARIQISARMGDDRTRRGEGAFEIVDGHIFRLPIMLAILNVINLTVPDADAFDDATAEFLIEGNDVSFDRIFLKGSALTLAGSGSMSLPDYGLDLNLINISPHTWARIPGLSTLVEGASRELVEFHVTGPLSQPTVTAKPLRRITEELRRIFQKRPPNQLSAHSP